MKQARRRDPTWIGVLDRVHACALRAYPRAFRQRWGAAMRQLLRDRCRDLHRAGCGPSRMLLSELLPDLVLGAAREHLANLFSTHPQGTAMSSISSLALRATGGLIAALAATGLVAGLWNGRFTHPGTFDSLTALQLAMAAAGCVLFVLGVREAKRTPETARPVH